MTSLDNSIIEYFAEFGRHKGAFLKDSPYHVWDFLHDEIEVTEKSRNTVGRRMRKLAEAGLLDRVAQGEYQLTELGYRYSQGDLTDEEREQLKDELLS